MHISPVSSLLRWPPTTGALSYCVWKSTTGMWKGEGKKENNFGVFPTTFSTKQSEQELYASHRGRRDKATLSPSCLQWDSEGSISPALYIGAGGEKTTVFPIMRQDQHTAPNLCTTLPMQFKMRRSGAQTVWTGNQDKEKRKSWQCNGNN